MQLSRKIKYYLPFIKARLAKRGLFMVPSPKSATINITENCNSKCLYCDQWRNKKTSSLSYKQVKELYKKLLNAGIDELLFSGGEPLMRDDLPDIIGLAKQKGFKRVSITTNGLLINENKLLILAKKGLDSMTISIDGDEKTNDFLRGVKGSYKKNINNLELLNKNSQLIKIKKNIGTVLSIYTLKHIPLMVELARKYNASLALSLIDNRTFFANDIKLDKAIIKEHDLNKLDSLIKYLKTINNQNPRLLVNNNQSLDYARRYFDDSLIKDVPCYLGFFKVFIGSKGEVFSGCWQLPDFGNFNKIDFKQLFKSKQYKKRLRDMINKRCQGCSCGYIINSIVDKPL